MSRWLAVAICLLSPLASHAAWPRHTIDDSSRGADGVRLADVNGDGHLDIATGWEEGGLIRVYVNPGPTAADRPWPAVTVGSVKSPEDAVLVDVDGDGALDVVSSCEGKTRTVFIHWAPNNQADYLQADKWTTTAVECTHSQQMWMFALPLQMDDRHGVDLVLGSKGTGATVGWLESPADPRATRDWVYHTLSQAGWIMSLQSYDMDTDGDLEIVVSDRKGPRRGVYYLENPGPQATAEGAPWGVQRLGADDREVMFLTLCDFAQIGDRDIFAAVRGRGISHLHRLATSSETWQHRELPWPPGCGTGKGVAIGDVNLDGRNDLVFSCENARGQLSGVRWLSAHVPSGRPWADHEISGARGVKFDRLELLDLDGDGDLDVITCEERENLGVIWYENPSRQARS